MNTNTATNRTSSSADSWLQNLAAARAARTEQADSPIGHRVFRRGYPHFTGTFMGMWSPEFAYVQWDVDVVIGERAIVDMDKIVIMKDREFPLSVAAPF